MSLKKSDTIMAAFWGANNTRKRAFLVRQMVRDGKDAAAILEAVKADGALPRSPLAPNEGALEDWIAGMREAITEVRNERPDLHQEMIDSYVFKLDRAERDGRERIRPWDAIFTHQERVAWLLGWFNRQMMQNGFWGMVGNLNRNAVMMPALAQLVSEEMHRDPELLNVVRRVATCALSASLSSYHGEDEDVRRRTAKAEEASADYQRLGSITDGYVETRALDLYQAIVAEWKPDNDPYAMEKLGPLARERQLDP